MPVGIKTYGAYGPQAIKLIEQIGKKYRKLLLKNFLLFISSRVSLYMAIQKGNKLGPVIQANGRMTFEDDLRSGGLLYFTTQ